MAKIVDTTLADSFAGIGGSTEGAKRAGAQVVIAANHSPLAVHWHELNHPEVVHRCQDLRQADFGSFPDTDGLIASPSCKGHTQARGKERPHHDSDRGTAWAVVDHLEAKRPYFGVAENVPRFLEWELYPAWEDACRRLGYAISVNVLDAADYGIPQNRKRVLIILTRSRNPFPLRAPKRPHVPVSNILRLDDYRWSPINKAGRSQKTLDRIARGRARFGDCFLFPYYSSGSGLTGRSLDRPLGTIPTKDRWAVVRGDKMRMLQVDEYLRAMDFPVTYKLPSRKDEAISLIGDAVPPGMMEDTISQLRRAA